MRNSKLMFVIIGSFILITLLFNVMNGLNVQEIDNCKIIDLKQQQLVDSNDGDITTKYRYLVITDKETFICESSLLNGKFNNSDIFYRLNKDSIYNFKVCGIGKTIISDYRNILEIK